MAVILTWGNSSQSYDKYSDMYPEFECGKYFLALPQAIQDAIDDFFSGLTISLCAQLAATPNNVWHYLYGAADCSEVLTTLGFLTYSDYDALVKSDKLTDFINDNYQAITNSLGFHAHILGYVPETQEWHLMYRCIDFRKPKTETNSPCEKGVSRVFIGNL